MTTKKIIEYLKTKARVAVEQKKAFAAYKAISNYYQEEAETFLTIADIVNESLSKRTRHSFLGDAIDHWSVEDLGDQIDLMSGGQARNALHAIRRGSLFRAAIKIGYMTNPVD